VYTCAAIALAMVVLINGALLYGASTDAYAYLDVVFILVPGVNFLAAALSVPGMFVVRRLFGDVKTWPFILIVSLGSIATLIISEFCLLYIHPPSSC
jgi:hypothetical protein